MLADETTAAQSGNSPDEAIAAIAAELESIPGFAVRAGLVLRQTYDQIYDGQHTGRYRWDQLAKVEKTHFGSLVEINLRREFGFKDGIDLDFHIAGHDVDCKWSQTWGSWMMPPEALNKVCLLVHGDEEAATFSIGLVRCVPEVLRNGANRDAKLSLSASGRSSIRHLLRNAPFPPNVLLQLPRADVEAILTGMAGKRKGQPRLDELFRRAQGMRVTRGVVATIAQQDDFMKRVRANGGSRTKLRPEGICVLGDYTAHQEIARSLGCAVPGAGESVSVRVFPCEASAPGSAWIDGGWWRMATSSDPVVLAPRLPEPREGRSL